MAEKIASENGRISNFKGLMTLTLDRVILHTIVHHSSTSTYMPNFIAIEETFSGQTFETGFIRSTLRRVDLKSYPHRFFVLKVDEKRQGTRRHGFTWYTVVITEMVVLVVVVRRQWQLKLLSSSCNNVLITSAECFRLHWRACHWKRKNKMSTHIRWIRNILDVDEATYLEVLWHGFLDMFKLVFSTQTTKAHRNYLLFNKVGLSERQLCGSTLHVHVVKLYQSCCLICQKFNPFQPIH